MLPWLRVVFAISNKQESCHGGVSERRGVDEVLACSGKGTRMGGKGHKLRKVSYSLPSGRGHDVHRLGWRASRPPTRAGCPRSQREALGRGCFALLSMTTESPDYASPNAADDVGEFSAAWDFRLGAFCHPLFAGKMPSRHHLRCVLTSGERIF